MYVYFDGKVAKITAFMINAIYCASNFNKRCKVVLIVTEVKLFNILVTIQVARSKDDDRWWWLRQTNSEAIVHLKLVCTV